MYRKENTQTYTHNNLQTSQQKETSLRIGLIKETVFRRSHSTWKRTRGVGVSGRLDPIIRTRLRYWPHSSLSHTGTSYSRGKTHKDFISSTTKPQSDNPIRRTNVCALTISGGTPKYSSTKRIAHRKSSTKDMFPANGRCPQSSYFCWLSTQKWWHRVT